MKIVNFLEAGARFDIPPVEGISYWLDRGLRPTFDWREMLGDEHYAAFTVAKMMDTDLLTTVRSKLTRALEQGTSLADFKAELIPSLQEAGWWGKRDVIDPRTGAVVGAQLGSASRLETIFRSNLQGAYAVGQWQSIRRSVRTAPYLMYDAVDDNRTRPDHAARDGQVHEVNSDFWKTHFPPNGWNCRCGVIQLTASEVKELGITPQGDPQIQTVSWTNPRTGITMKVPADVDPGWDYNPGAKRFEHLEALANEKAEQLLQSERRRYRQNLRSMQAAEKAEYGRRLSQMESVATLSTSTEKATREIREALESNTRYLAAEIRSLQARDAQMAPVALLAIARERAAARERQAIIASWRRSLESGREPSATVQAYFDRLPVSEKAALLRDIDGAAD